MGAVEKRTSGCFQRSKDKGGKPSMTIIVMLLEREAWGLEVSRVHVPAGGLCRCGLDCGAIEDLNR